MAHLVSDRRAYFDERDRQTRLLYPRLDADYGFARAAGRRTLELGCGMGYNAQRLAQCGARLTALDLAPKAVRLTRERFQLRGLPADFLVADAEHLPFRAGAFELVYSSGVIHHSPDTARAAREIERALQRGGTATVMVYNRNSIWFWWNIVLGLGILMTVLNRVSAGMQARLVLRRPAWRDLILPAGQRLRFEDVLRAGTDFGGLRNPLSRVYTRRSARRLFTGLTDHYFVTQFNQFRALEPAPAVWVRAARRLFDWLNRRWGWFLIINATKP
ncbi:MAG: class I SAM-dependent methyltransferase [Anaerolineales bacterium]